MDFGKLLLKILGVAKDHFEGSENDEQPRRQSQSYQQTQTVQRPVSPTVEREKTDEEWKAYFREILLREFPSFTIRENVPVTDLAGYANDEFQLYNTRPRQAYKAEWGQPYTFVLDKSGARAVVMLGKGHSHDSGVKFLIARMYAKKMGLPYINFYTQMANERSYVIERIHKFID
ncbi:MAG: hypothetical protein K5683_02575 [Prevotella sp.]|nr:hypothetical protein [Prevotella sp.]